MALKPPFYGHPAAMPWQRTPITAVIIGFAVLVALATDQGRGELSLWLYIINPVTGEQDVWRWLSPAFLHFGWLHLVFNCLWLFAVGRLIEWRSSSAFILVFLASALAGNALQWFMGDWRFGGLSGVVYGVVGYVWLWDRLRADKYAVPPVYLGISLFFLLIGFANLDGILGVNMANGAHLGGLLGGLAVALLHALVEKR